MASPKLGGDYTERVIGTPDPIERPLAPVSVGRGVHVISTVIKPLPNPVYRRQFVMEILAASVPES